MSFPVIGCENAVTRGANGLEVGMQTSQKETLGYDRVEAPALGDEQVADCAMDRLGLSSRVERSGDIGGGRQRKKSSLASGPSTRRTTTEQSCVWIPFWGKFSTLKPRM